MTYHVQLRWDELLTAYNQGSADKRYFLDVQTGEITPVFVDLVERGGNPEDARRIASGINVRYFLIPHKPSSEGYAEMEDFINTAKDKRLREQLIEAIEGKGAFRRFRDVLATSPVDEERWVLQKEENTGKDLTDWLLENDIELLENG